MSNDTQRLARAWAELVLTQEIITPEAVAAAEHILATTTPPTMADVEWDHDKYHLHGATTPKGDEVVMLWHDDIDTDHIITDHAEWPRDRLTPNGKRYELREVGAPEQPEHPETLVTLEDYENAPVGTVVAMRGCFAWTKGGCGDWGDGDGRNWDTNGEMAGIKRDVLRKGWGK